MTKVTARSAGFDATAGEVVTAKEVVTAGIVLVAGEVFSTGASVVGGWFVVQCTVANLRSSGSSWKPSGDSANSGEVVRWREMIGGR